jgi:nucleotide-binding universal stress UspA family protein
MTAGTAQQPVLVGIDYSTDSDTAADYGAWEALRRRLPLRLIHAIEPPVAYGAGMSMSAMVNDATTLLNDTTDRLRQRHPELVITSAVLTAGPAATLVAESAQASMVVVGTRGAGGFPELLTGSVSVQVAAHAHAPVVVVRVDGLTPPAGPVVVGVDGSDQSVAAVAFAAEQAQARQCPLIAVYAWDIPSYQYLGTVSRRNFDLVQARDQAERIMAEALAGLTQEYPDLPVDRRVVHAASPAATLRDRAAGAGLLVVGSRGHGGFVGLLLGSVSRALVSHARCSIAVVHTG